MLRLTTQHVTYKLELIGHILNANYWVDNMLTKETFLSLGNQNMAEPANPLFKP
jgi:hypothetical protein